MPDGLSQTILDTYRYCKSEDFAGWDPYDGLNSRVFQKTPLNNSYWGRLFWIQGFKHSPINLRRIMQVDKGHNPKGLGLCLSAIENLIQSALVPPDSELERDMISEVRRIADLLLELASSGYRDYCWGYNFAWQSRAFYLPKWTPTVVATAFAVDGLLAAYRLTDDHRYLDACVSSQHFALRDLNKIETPTGVGFSYSPLDSRLVYNATLLGARYLSAISEATGDQALLKIAKLSVESTREAFSEDGSFDYARESYATWRDNFHTGFNLEALARYRKVSGDRDYDTVIDKAAAYWLESFFLQDGTCKYYDNKVYPLDIHCSAQVFPTLHHLGKMEEQKEFLRRVTHHMQKTFYLTNGSYRFQVKKQFAVNIPYFRWGTAWAFYGLSYYARAFGKGLT